MHLTCQVRLSCLYAVVACVVVLLRAVCAYWSRIVAVRAYVTLQHVLCFVLCIGFGGRCLGGVRCAQVLHCCSSFAGLLWLPVSRRIVCVLTSSYDVMVVGVRSSRCFVILFPFCVRSFFWFVLCAVCLCGESVRLCVLFFVCGRGCSPISHHHHHHHHQHHDHLTRASNPWRSKGLVDFARYDCFCLVSVHLHRKKDRKPTRDWLL